MLKPKVRVALSASTTNLLCHGGAVQTAPKMYLIFWGSAWNTSAGDPDGVMNRVLAFSQSVFGSSWLNTTTQYYDGQLNIVGNTPAIYAGAAVDSSDPSAAPSMTDLVNEAAKFAGSTGDFSTQANYVILTPHGIVPDGTFTASACAYHTYFTNGNSINVPFTVFPYQPDEAGCGGYSVNAGPSGVLDGVSEVLGHEQAETETDPLLDAWFDASGQEIADKCEASTLGTYQGYENNPYAGGFPTQPLWSNVSASCIEWF
jgi:hypothetical protein